MSTKLFAFSLIELLIALTILSILTAVAIPSYKNYIIKAKITDLFVLADAHKLKLAEKIMSGDATTVNDVINNPHPLVEKLEYLNVDNKKYSLKLTTNMLNLGISTHDKPLIIMFTGEEQQDNNLITWNCHHNVGFSHLMPNSCKEMAQ